MYWKRKKIWKKFRKILTYYNLYCIVNKCVKQNILENVGA